MARTKTTHKFLICPKQPTATFDYVTKGIGSMPCISTWLANNKELSVPGQSVGGSYDVTSVRLAL